MVSWFLTGKHLYRSRRYVGACDGMAKYNQDQWIELMNSFDSWVIGNNM